MRIVAEPILNLKRDGATCTLLILDDDVHILLDCGLNAAMDFSAYNQHLHKLKKVDMILLSHVGAEYVGALPFLLSNKSMGNQAKNLKIYSTTPIMKLGLFNAYNLYLNTMLLSNYEEYHSNSHNLTTFRKFYTSYDKCKQIQFFQKKVVRINQKDIIISPVCIGNSLGACAWIIQDYLINIMYMIQFNHNRDEHLDGMNISRFIKKRIDVLITEQTLLPSDTTLQPSTTTATSNTTLHLSNIKSISSLKDTLKAAIQKAVASYSILVIVSNPSERVIEIIMILWQIFNESKKTQGEMFPPIDFFHNYKKYMQDLINDQIKYMRMETRDVLVDFDPLAPESNFINFENVLPTPGKIPGTTTSIPQQQRGPRIIITTICCLYFPKMFDFIIELANSDKNTLLFVGKQNSKNSIKRQQGIRQGYFGVIREEPLVLSELTKSILKQFHAPPTSQDQENSSSGVQSANSNGNNSAAAASDDIADNMTVATAFDTAAMEDLDGRGIDMDKDIFNNDEIEIEQLFDNKQKDFSKFLYNVTEFKKSEFGEELTEEEAESLKKISSRKNKKDQHAERSYKTPEKIAQEMFELMETNVRDPKKDLTPFTPFFSAMNIQEFNIISISDERSLANIFTLLNPKKIFYVNQSLNLNQEILSEDTEIHNQSLDIYNFKNKIQMSSKMQGHRFVGKITMVYNPASEGKVNVSLEQEMNNQNPNREYYGNYPLEKLLEYLQKSGYTFTVAWGGINYLDKVIIKKNNQNFSLEGIRCKEFYEIRKLVYDFLETS